MAYVKRTTTICEYSDCMHPATMEVFSEENYSVGKYCSRHGHLKLNELNKLENH